MGLGNSTPLRVDVALADWIHEIAKENGLTSTQASRELAKLRKKMTEEKKKIIKEIRY